MGQVLCVFIVPLQRTEVLSCGLGTPFFNAAAVMRLEGTMVVVLRLGESIQFLKNSIRSKVRKSRAGIQCEKMANLNLTQHPCHAMPLRGLFVCLFTYLPILLQVTLILTSSLLLNTRFSSKRSSSWKKSRACSKSR